MDDLELIKQKINIVDLIQEYIPLKKTGVNFKASCPFHQEKTPSFVVSPERGIWHCFGCLKGGDAFKFLMEKEGLSFGDAVESLAKKAGVTLKRAKSQTHNLRDKLLDSHLKSTQFFHHILTKHPLGKAALQYLKSRGLTDETIEVFELGYSPNSWDSLAKFLQKRGYPIQDLIDAGLVVPSKNKGYDRFRGRVMFPLKDVKKQVIGFAGRILSTGEPKYINSPQTLIFDKSNFLFGLDLSKNDIRQSNFAILVEGEMDMIMSYQSGVKNVVASKGTALTSGQIELIKKYADTIVLCFDKDLAGDTASRRGIEMADQAGLNIKVIQIEDSKDPAELAVKDLNLWKQAVAKAEPIYDYYLRSVSMRYNFKTAQGKKNIASELIPIWSKISDSLTFEHYLQKLAALLEITDEILRREILKQRNLKAPAVNLDAVVASVPKTAVNIRTRQDLLEEYLMTLLMHIPQSSNFIPSFPETLFLVEDYRSLYVLYVLYLDSISFKNAAFSISEFVKTLPDELIGLVDRLYLTEIDDKLAAPRHWQQEVDKVVVELKRSLIRASLEKLSAQIKSAQVFGKIEILETLNRRFRDLSVKLKTL